MSWISGRGFLDPVPGADETRNSARGGGTSTATSTDVSTIDSSPASPGSAESGSIVLESLGSDDAEGIGEGIEES